MMLPPSDATGVSAYSQVFIAFGNDSDAVEILLVNLVKLQILAHFVERNDADGQVPGVFGVLEFIQMDGLRCVWQSSGDGYSFILSLPHTAFIAAMHSWRVMSLLRSRWRW